MAQLLQVITKLCRHRMCHLRIRRSCGHQETGVSRNSVYSTARSELGAGRELGKHGGAGVGRHGAAIDRCRWRTCLRSKQSDLREPCEYKCKHDTNSLIKFSCNCKKYICILVAPILMQLCGLHGTIYKTRVLRVFFSFTLHSQGSPSKDSDHDNQGDTNCIEGMHRGNSWPYAGRFWTAGVDKRGASTKP